MCSLIRNSVYWEKNLRRVPDRLGSINKQFDINIFEKRVSIFIIIKIDAFIFNNNY